MKKLYIITGAGGHLGSALLLALRGADAEKRALLLPGESIPEGVNAQCLTGDVTKPETLAPLFEGAEGYETVVVHAAGIVSIESEVSPKLRAVNVQGTKNILALCKEYKVKRLVYVSSVHAIPEAANMAVMTEIHTFDPQKVIGGYARTKAEATAAVLDAVENGGLDAVVVHPSGILGPYNGGTNHMVQLVKMVLMGRLPAGVTGGYDFVDVRDVALGCLAAAEKGRKGECYILSNRYCTVRELLAQLRLITRTPRKPCVPLWIAKLAAPLLQWFARVTRTRPLFTPYSLHTLGSNSRFSHDKATMELGYSPRDLRLTLEDTVLWLKESLPKKPAKLAVQVAK